MGDLARSMSLNVDKVWAKRDGREILADVTTIRPDELVAIHMGEHDPF